MAECRWRVLAFNTCAYYPHTFIRCGNAFTHARVHIDCGVCVAQDNDFELVMRSTHPLRADYSSFRYLVVRVIGCGRCSRSWFSADRGTVVVVD